MEAKAARAADVPARMGSAWMRSAWMRSAWMRSSWMRSAWMRSAWLVGWGAAPRFGMGEGVVLALWALVAALVLPFHEPWSDEAQAWLIGRDASFYQIVRYRLHYEGSPALWHFLIRLFHLLGGTYAGFGWFGAALAMAGVLVWLWGSPFPKLLRWLLPFTFFVQYQYAVIARSYVLFPLLVWVACAAFARRPRKPAWFAVAASLLANLSMQGMVLSGVLMLLYLWDLWRERRRLRVDSSTAEAPAVRTLAPGLPGAVLIALLGVGIAFYTAIPAPDVSFAVGNQANDGLVHRMLVRVIGESPKWPVPARPDERKDNPAADGLGAVARVAVAKAIPPPPAPPSWMPAWPKPPLWKLRYWLAWECANQPPGIRGVPHVVLDNLQSFAAATTTPLANSNLLSCAFLLAGLVWAWRRGVARALLPWVAVLVMGTVIWVADHHTGMSLVALLGGFWIVAALHPARTAGPRWEAAFSLLMLAVFGVQMAWSAVTLRNEVRGSYDPSREVARFLQREHAGARMAGFQFWATGIQPFYRSNPFFNLPSSYWLWTTNIDSNGAAWYTLTKHPDVVVYSWETYGEHPMRNQWLPMNEVEVEPHSFIQDELVKAGYHQTHRFCGARFFRFSDSYRVCDDLWEPLPGAAVKMALTGDGALR